MLGWLRREEADMRARARVFYAIMGIWTVTILLWNLGILSNLAHGTIGVMVVAALLLLLWKSRA